VQIQLSAVSLVAIRAGQVPVPGQIANSFARGNVGGLTIANLQAGGLVGNNAGRIQASAALGNVQTGGGSTAGGLVAQTPWVTDPIVQMHRFRASRRWGLLSGRPSSLYFKC
jgi:hypothetical protein